MKGSLIIVSFFVLGIIVGLCDVIPADGMMIFARILQRWNLKSAERQARTA